MPMTSHKIILAGGLLKRLKDADASSTSSGYSVQFNTECARTTRINPYPAPRPPVCQTVQIWSVIVAKFEEKYTRIYMQTNMKKKAHLDCIQEGSNLVHEPKQKWCHVLLLDALVHSAHDYTFSALVESSVRRRKFNQHLELRNSIIEVLSEYNNSNPNTSHQSGNGVVTPDLIDCDNSRMQTSSASSASNSKPVPPKAAIYRVSPVIHDRIWTPPNHAPHQSGADQKTKKRKYKKKEDPYEKDIPHDNTFAASSSSFGVDNRGAGKVGYNRIRFNQWESHENFKEYLLSLAGTGKSSKRFATVVNDLCARLASSGTEKKQTRSDRDRYYCLQATPSIPRGASSLMDIITAAIAKVASPLYQMPSSYCRDPITIVPDSAPVRDFDFYDDMGFSFDNDYKLENSCSGLPSPECASMSTSTSQSFPASIPCRYDYCVFDTIIDARTTGTTIIKQEKIAVTEASVSVSTPYIIPVEHSLSEFDAEDTDDEDSCDLGAEPAYDGPINTYPKPYRHSQPTIPSFTEMWDDEFSESADLCV